MRGRMPGSIIVLWGLLVIIPSAARAETPADSVATHKVGKEPAPAPFAFADFSWVPGNAGPSERPLTVGPFTGEFRMDDVGHWSFAEPKDNTISGSSEAFRHGEFQVTQLGIGGDLLYKNVMGRIMTQFGSYSTTTPRNDPSPARGQWQLGDSYRYVSEAYG